MAVAAACCLVFAFGLIVLFSVRGYYYYYQIYTEPFFILAAAIVAVATIPRDGLPRHTRSLLTIAMMVAAAGTLAACGGGGGGGGGSSGATPAATPATPASINLAAACSGSNCGALGNTYAGSGVGVWQATNTGGSAGTVNVSIAGLTGQNVTLIYTNQGAVAQPMPSVSLSNAGLLGLGGGTTTSSTPTSSHQMILRVG